MMTPLHVDILIAGGGPTGAVAALGYARAGHRVALVEARERDAELKDARAIALSGGSYDILRQQGAWCDELNATAIDTVHVSQQGAFGRTVIRGEDLGLDHLGWVVDYPRLTRLLDAQLEQAGVQVLWGRRVTAVSSVTAYATATLDDGSLISSRLVVLAEGGALAETLKGVTRHVHDYRQCAVLARVKTTRPHDGVAYERFSDQGPLALLPHGDDFMMVWTRSEAEAHALLAAGGEQVARELAGALGDRQGEIVEVSGLALFPLVLKQLNRVSSGRVVMIGNAAQTMHPVAAQGLNLGLRDAADLLQLTAGKRDPGAAALLAAYRRARRLDSHAVVGFTHGLIQLVEHSGPLMKQVRGLGMAVLDSIPLLRKSFASHLVYGVGRNRV